MRYLEDMSVGPTATVGECDVTGAEIEQFARDYDPQPFHPGEDAAVITDESTALVTRCGHDVER